MYKILSKKQRHDLKEHIKLNKSKTLNHIPSLMKKLCAEDPSYIKYAQGAAASLELFEQVLNHPDTTLEMLTEATHYTLGIRNNYEIMKKLCAIDGSLIRYCSGDILTFELFEIALNSKNKKLSQLDVEAYVSYVDFSNVSLKELERFIAYDGNLLRKIDEKRITKKLVELAFSNPNPYKKPSVKNLYNMKDSKSLMRYLCEIDGMNFIHGYENALTADNLKIALNHPDPKKRLAFERIPDDIELTLKFSEIKDLIAKDPRWIKFIDINSLNEFELLSVLKTNNIIPNSSVISHFRKNKKVLTAILSEAKKDKYTSEQLMEMLSLEVDYKLVNTDFFNEISKIICEKEKIDHNFFKYQVEHALFSNKGILMTLNFKLLQNRFHKLYEENNYEKLYTLSIYPQIQKAIVEIGNPKDEKSTIDIALGDKRITLLSSMLKSSLKFKSGEKVNDWPVYYNKIITKFAKDPTQFDWAINNLEQLSEEEITKLANHVLGNHKFKITSLKKLENYEEIRTKWITEQLKSDDLNEVKDAAFEKIFGMSLSSAKELVPYRIGILASPQSFHPDIVEFMKAVDQILKEENIDLLRNTVNSFTRNDKLDEKDIVNLRSMLKKQYTKEYNASLFNIQNKKPDDILEGISLYKAAGNNGEAKFNLCIHSLSAYLSDNEYNKVIVDYKKAWNRPEMINHGICSSYIGNSNLGTATNRYAIFGFTNLEEGSILLSGPEDIYSLNESFDTMGDEDNKSTYLTPQDMLDYTRHTHNEMVLERKVGAEKRQPSYIVLLCDDYEKDLKKFKLQQMIGRYTLIGKITMMNDIKPEDTFYNAIKAAKDFGISIVVVEREKIAKHEYQQIQDKLKEFENRNDFTRDEVKAYYHDIIIIFANNHAGNRIHHPKMERMYFNEAKALEIIKRINTKISKLSSSNPTQALLLIDELEKAMNLEKDKTPMNSCYHSPVFKTNVTIDQCIQQRKKIIENLGKNTSINCAFDGSIKNESHLLEYNSSVAPLDLEQYQITDISKIISPEEHQQLLLKINQINQDGLYQNKVGAHSRRHIENVIFFASLIGHDLVSHQDMDLLLTAALYHDAGRTSDGHVPHAVASSVIAKEKLKDKYSKEQLQIIRAAIEYHEIVEKRKDDQSIDFNALTTICQNLGMDINNKTLMEKTKTIATCLKDADALDRTRFLSKTKSFTSLNMLHHETSKKLIKIGTQINEYYATIDLEKVCEVQPEVASTIISHLKQNKNPKLTIRCYRHVEFNKVSKTEENYGKRK